MDSFHRPHFENRCSNLPLVEDRIWEFGIRELIFSNVYLNA